MSSLTPTYPRLTPYQVLMVPTEPLELPDLKEASVPLGSRDRRVNPASKDQLDARETPEMTDLKVQQPSMAAS